MGLFDRVEGKLERAYNGLFARAFRAEVQPVEIASAIRRAMDDRASHAGRGRALVPNLFTIELSDSDHERLAELGDGVSEELVVAAEEHVASQHYTPGGPIRINLIPGDDLETGVFRVRPSTAKRPDATGHTGERAPVRRHEVEPDVDSVEDPRGDWEDDGGYAAGSGAAAGSAAAGAGSAGAGLAGASAGVGAAARVTPPAPAKPQAPSPPRKVKASDRPCLLHDGHRYLLISAINVVGRDDDADVVLDDPGISRRHSEIRVSIDGPHFVAVIRDLGSTNGTFVNGERVDAQRLHDGDQVTVGRTSLTYRANRP